MPVVRVSDRADFMFEAGGHDAEVLRVTRFHGTEGLSQLGRFEIELTSTDADIDFDALVGEKACLSWKGVEDNRWVHGIVSNFELTGFGRSLTYYAARLVPRVWLLTRRAQCQIFQNMTTPDILEQVLKEGGVPADEFKITAKRSYKVRKYCVQYRETDFDFLSRLMEEEGIFYFFEHTEDGCVMHLSDDASVHQVIAGTATIPYHAAQEGNIGGEAISLFRYGRSVRTGMVTLREFDFKKPSLDLTLDTAADKWKELEVYDYPGAYPDSGLGKEYAKIRLEEVQVRREFGDGDANARLMVPGFKFTLEGFNREDVNQEYVITRVHHWGSQPQAGEEEATSNAGESEPMYQNDFTCIPSSRPFRPERVTPHPVIDGPQTAVVTGPDGEEIHCDEFGRVKIRFHWDRSGLMDDKSSCWVRVSQSMSGSGFGSVHIPRIGEEVIVSFLEGDPDQPVITGRVYNGENPVPYDLPAMKTQSTIKSNTTPGGGGSNEMRFEDAAGSEEVYVHAQKDYNTVIENDRTRLVGHDETLEIKNIRKKKVGVDQEEDIGANKKIHVGGNHGEGIDGNMGLQVGGNRDATITGDDSAKVGGSLSETVTVAYTQTIGVASTEIVGAAKTVNVGGPLAFDIGGGVTMNIGGGQTFNVTKDAKENVGGTKTVSSKGKMTLTTKADAAASADGKMDLTSKGDLTIKSDAKIVIDGANEIVIKSGSSSITLKGSGIEIKGAKVVVKADGDVKIKGATIGLN